MSGRCYGVRRIVLKVKGSRRCRMGVSGRKRTQMKARSSVRIGRLYRFQGRFPCKHPDRAVNYYVISPGGWRFRFRRPSVIKGRLKKVDMRNCRLYCSYPFDKTSKPNMSCQFLSSCNKPQHPGDYEGELRQCRRGRFNS